MIKNIPPTDAEPPRNHGSQSEEKTKTLKNYNIAFSGAQQNYLNELSEKDFQGFLYAVCNQRYPELNSLYFNIDSGHNETYLEVKYKNSLGDE